MRHPISPLRSTLAGLVLAALAVAPLTAAPAATQAAPLALGDTFTLESKILQETRRINVYRPPGYDEAGDRRFPVLYMPDGGMAEDFLHVAGLVQVSVGNGTMRPFLLVGIENTERRRDMTGPTQSAADKKIAPRVGGSASFRQFLRQELMPAIRARYRTTEETALIGESLAGLFTVETLLLEPDLFDTYIALDPSLWWDDHRLVKEAPARLAKPAARPKTLFLATSDELEIAATGERFAALFTAQGAPGVKLRYAPMPAEHHSTIYHPAALLAFRTLFAPGGPAAPGQAAEDREVAALLERQTQELLDAVGAGKAEVWDRYLDPAVSYTDESGTILAKAELLAGLKPLPAAIWGKLKVTKFVVHRHGDTAIATYTSEEEEGYYGQVLHTRYLETDTWMRRPDGWRLVAAQVLAPRADPPALPLPAGRLDEYVGEYALTPEVRYTIRREGEGLVGQRTGRQPEPLRAEVPDLFFVPGQPRLRKVFQRGPDGRITGFVERRETWDIAWKRLG